MNTEEYAQLIQADLHYGQSPNEQFLVLVKWLVRVEAENFNAGLRRAAQIIAPDNPESRSPNAEIRGDCRRQILTEVHQ